MKNSVFKWLKRAGVSLIALSMAAGITRDMLDAQAKKELSEGLKKHPVIENFSKFYSSPVDTAAERRLNEDMDIHAALLFYCSPKISEKIAGFTSADGHELVQEKEKYFLVWQEDLKQQDTLWNVLKTLDPVTKTQICVTFDRNKKDLVVHLGGTDFASPYDLLAAGTAGLEGLSPRAPSGIAYADSVSQLMKLHYPEIASGDVHLSIVAHSQGAAVAPAMTVALAEDGFTVNKVMLLDPFGARRAYDYVAKYLGLSPSVFETNVVTVKPSQGSSLDYFKKATEPVGKKEISTAQGHLGKHFIEAYNKERSKLVQPSSKVVFKHTTIGQRR